MKRRKGKEKSKLNEIINLVDNESTELIIEELIEVQGGIEDKEKDKDVPVENCGLGCYLGSGADVPIEYPDKK